MKLPRSWLMAAILRRWQRSTPADPGSAARGGDLGFAGRGVYVEPFEQALFALQPGETSAPVKTEFGYHIIRLEAVKASDGQDFEQVRGQLAEALREQKAQDDFYALAERLDDLALENPGSLEPAAQEARAADPQVLRLYARRWRTLWR